MKKDIRKISTAELSTWMDGIGEKAFRTKQIEDWLWNKWVKSFEEMANLSKDLRQKLDAELVEMKRCKTNGLCCGAGGAQMFKEAEKGSKEVNIERMDDVLEIKPNILATGCPFCNTMMTDGVKHFEKEKEISVLDIAELIAQAQDL